jgi:4-carboxymuconolactone decarboxylase
MTRGAVRGMLGPSGPMIEARITMRSSHIVDCLAGFAAILAVLAVSCTFVAQNAAGSTSNTRSTMPSDIDPQSGFRLPLPKREDLDDAGKRGYDRANTPGKTIVGLRGPGGIGLYSTKTIEARNAVNRYLRYEAGFDPKVREISILTVAREMNSQFEWAAHEPEALKEGVSPQVIAVIKNRGSTEGLAETDAAIIEFGRQIFRDHKVSSAAYARMRALFEPTKLVELVLLMGTYSSTAVLLTAFDMQLPEGQKPLLPLP